MPKLYITIGLPGSGRSEWVTNQHIKSFCFRRHYQRARALQEDISDNNLRLRVREMCVEALRQGEDCIYHDINFSRKSRRKLIALAREIKQVEIIAVVFIATTQECKEHILATQGSYQNGILEHLITNFEMPTLGEGFDKIEFIKSEDVNQTPIEDFLNPMRGFDQKHTLHTLDLYNHCMATYNNLLKNNPEYVHTKTINFMGKSKTIESVNSIMGDAAKLHDFGKIYTQDFYPDGNVRYDCHENVAAYYIMSQYKSKNAIEIATLVNYHMIPYKYNVMSEKIKLRTKQELSSIWKDIFALYSADVAAR